jgi:hypothetical protein
MKKVAFVIEIFWANGETERFAFIDETWHGATEQADKYVKSLNRGEYSLSQESCGLLIFPEKLSE